MLREHLRGERSLDDAVEQFKIRTNRYGKQQRTWLRRFLMVRGAIRVDPVGPVGPVDREPSEIAAEIAARV